MPTVLKIRGYRFFFFSLENKEPVHIHVESGDKYAKFWVEPAELARSSGFKGHELTEIRDLVKENKDLIINKWNEHFGINNE